MTKIKIEKLLNEHKLMISNDYFYFDNKRFCVETNNEFKQLDDVHKVKIYFDGGYMDYAIKFIYGNNLEFTIFLRQITNIKIEDMYKNIVTNGVYVKIKCSGKFDPKYVTTAINNITGIAQDEDSYMVLFKFGMDPVCVDRETADEIINLVYMNHNADY